MKLSLSRILLFSCAICMAPAFARAADPTGTWQWSTTNSKGTTSQFTARFLLRGSSLVGTVTTPRGDKQIDGGTFTGSSVSFFVAYSAAATARYSGTMTGDTITGTIMVTNPRGTVNQSWSARRDPNSVPTPSP